MLTVNMNMAWLTGIGGRDGGSLDIPSCLWFDDVFSVRSATLKVTNGATT